MVANYKRRIKFNEDMLRLQTDKMQATPKLKDRQELSILRLSKESLVVAVHLNGICM
jgi:hypothetical protein